MVLFLSTNGLDKLWSAVAMSLAGQLATLPLSIYYFHQFPVYFIISNLFILLPITFLMYGGLAILVLNVYCIAPFILNVLLYLLTMVQWISSLPYAGITEIWINQWQLLLICLFLLYATFGMVYYKEAYHSQLSHLVINASVLRLSKTQCFAARGNHFIQLTEKNYAAAFIVGNECVDRLK